MSLRKSQLRKKVFLTLCLIIAFLTLWKFSELQAYLNPDSIRENYQLIEHLVLENYLSAIVTFFIVYLLIAATCLPGLGILSFLSGMLFGFSVGTIICSFASSIGASIAFLMSRYFFREVLEERLAEKFNKVNLELIENGKFYLLSVRLLPVFPFQLINLVLGLSKVSLRDFYFYSQIGMLPVTAIITYAGARSTQISEIGDIFTPQIMSALFLIACVPLLGRVYKIQRQKDLNRDRVLDEDIGH